MSMWLNYAKVPPSLIDEIKRDPATFIDAIWFEEGDHIDGIDLESDVLGLDYQTLVATWEGMEEIGMESPWARSATGEDYGNDLDYDVGYGPIFYFTTQEVAELAAGLDEEGWNEEDDEESLGKFFALAASEGKAVVGGIS